MRAYGTVTSDCLKNAETVIVKTKVLPSHGAEKF